MSFYARWIVIFWSLGVAVAQAEQLHVQIFYDDAPLKGVEVVVDGAPLGTTNAPQRPRVGPKGHSERTPSRVPRAN